MSDPWSCSLNSDLPVCSIALLGMQTAATEPPGMCAFTKLVPLRARPSRWGVRISLLPSAPMVSYLMSSANMNRMLGRFTVVPFFTTT